MFRWKWSCITCCFFCFFFLGLHWCASIIVWLPKLEKKSLNHPQNRGNWDGCLFLESYFRQMFQMWIIPKLSVSAFVTHLQATPGSREWFAALLWGSKQLCLCSAVGAQIKSLFRYRWLTVDESFFSPFGCCRAVKYRETKSKAWAVCSPSVWYWNLL